MNNEKQRIAIAEARGMIGPFENSEEWFENGDSDGCIIVLRDATGKRVANYLNDLNAMHEAEKTLSREQLESYIFEMHEIIGHNHIVRYVVTATAAQRAEAFLRALGKWEDDK